MTIEERVAKLEEKLSWLIRVSEKNIWYNEIEANRILHGKVTER